MTLRRRLLAYYSVTLTLALVVVALWCWHELSEQRDLILAEGMEAARREDPAWEATEVVLYGGLPALILGLLGGAVLTRRALRPILALTKSLEETTSANLEVPVPRSGNGDELDRMAAVFNEMKSRLGVSFTQTREFTLHASHELKTPLTILHGTLEQMLGQTGDGPGHRDRVGSMLEEVQRLSNIIGQLAFLAKADAGLLDTPCGRVALHDLVADLQEDLTHLGAARRLEVVSREIARVDVPGDRMRLRQILLILADNAVKHNRDGGSITLELTADTAAREAVFRMTNTGPVLAPALRPRVFERFFRGDPSHTTTAAQEGSGLGLSIAATIAKFHQGALDYGVTEDGLTSLTLRLPLCLAAG